MLRAFAVGLLFSTLAPFPLAGQAQTIKVVDMIPPVNSGESFQDSEPSLAINPSAPAQMAATAITTDPRYGSKGPVYVSLNSGAAWSIVAIVPSVVGSPFPYVDATVSFGGSNTLYAGILKSQGAGMPTPLAILSSRSFPSLAAMTQMAGSNRPDVDQPYVQAAGIMVGSAKRDLIFVGNDDYDIDTQFRGRTAAIDQFDQSRFRATMIESRRTSDRDGAPIRVAIHPDQTVYGAFLARRTIAGTSPNQFFVSDVVLVCDRRKGTALRTFNALKDSDGRAGKLAETSVPVPVTMAFGQERVGYDLAIATDPRTGQNNTVYIAWGDTQTGTYSLHLRRYTTAPTWSRSAELGPPRTFAKNPSLAINSDGTVLFLYQQLTGPAGNQSWETRIERSDDGFATPVTPVVLSTWKVNAPSMKYLPFLGDYAYVTAFDKNFYGVFSASNYPDMANFPQQATYQRKADWTNHTLLDGSGKAVPVSLDPFFFSVTPASTIP